MPLPTAADYSGSLTITRLAPVAEQFEIPHADARIQVSLELALRCDPAVMAVTVEGGSSFIEFRAQNGTVIYRIDAFDLGRAVLFCSLIHDGRTPCPA